VRLRSGGKCDRGGLRRPGHLHRRDAPLLRHPHPQRRLRYRDARAVAVRRTFLAVVVGLALMAGVVTEAAPGRAAGSCVTLEYLALLARADAALMAVPARPPAALAAVTQAEGLAPSSSPELDPVVAALRASPPGVIASVQRINVIVTTLALPAGSACSVDSRAAENALHQVYASSVFADLDQNQPPS